MKSWSAISLFLLPLALQAQTYHPMSVEGAHWILYSINEDGPDHHAWVIRGDTVIDGRDYKKMVRQALHSQATLPIDFLPPYYVDSEILAGAIRDEEADRKVYYYSFSQTFTGYDTCDLNKDLLLYDFSLSAGDTLTGCLQYHPDYPAVVEDVYTEFIFGEDRLFLNGGSFATPIMAGIGTGLGPFWSVYAFVHPAKPTVLIDYCIGPDESCNLFPTTAGERIDQWSVRIFPNPVGTRLFISLAQPVTEPVTLSVISQYGELCFSMHREYPEWSDPVDTSDLPSGLYYLRIQSGSAQWVGKFCKY